MKRYIAIVLTLMMLFLSGCAREQEQPSTPTQERPVTQQSVPETTEQTVPETSEETVPETTVPEPQVTEVESLLERVPAVLATFSRGDRVEVVGEYDETYLVVKLPEGWGLVEKSLLRMSGEAAYEPWTGYARYGACLYAELYLTGDPVRELSSNTRLEVMEDLGWCYLVRLDEITGYVARDQVSSYPLTGGSGGGAGADGGDISMGIPGGADRLGVFVPQEGTTTGEAEVLADGTYAILGWFNRGDMIPLAEAGFAEEREGYRTVYINGLFAYVPEQCFPEATESRTGYARWGAKLYEDLWLLDTDPDALDMNAQLTVLQDLEDCCLVEFDGKLGYIPKDMVSDTRIIGGGSSGGEWSPPVM